MVNPKSQWSEEERSRGEQIRRAWEAFFAPESPNSSAEESGGAKFGSSQFAEVLARKRSEVMRYPNVVGVSEGIRMRQGKPTGEHCIVVYVERKIPIQKLPPEAVLPAEIEGIPVDVVETGKIETLKG